MAKAPNTPQVPLSDKAERFCQQYVIDLNASQAALRAGYSPKTADKQGWKLLQDPRVAARIAELQAEIGQDLRITAEMVLKRWWDIANADPNDVMELRRCNCRFCWGVGHAYQWTPPEYERACNRAQRQGRPAPENIGGLDFRPNREPNPECPECLGEGVEKVHFHDTRRLTPEGKLIYRGVTVGKDGIKVAVADPDKALELVARHLGMFKDRLDVRMNPSEMSDAELDAEIARLKGEGA